ncbi:bacitracin resistance protein [Microbacterium aureliae]
MTGPTTDAATPRARRTATWAVAAIAGAFGLFYAYAVWNAVGNLTETLRVAGDLGLTLNALGWFLWIFAAVFPMLVWAAAFALGYRRPAPHLAVLMLTGLAVVAVFWLDVVSYATLNTTALIG